MSYHGIALPLWPVLEFEACVIQGHRPLSCLAPKVLGWGNSLSQLGIVVYHFLSVGLGPKDSFLCFLESRPKGLCLALFLFQCCFSLLVCWKVLHGLAFALGATRGRNVLRFRGVGSFP